MKKNRLTEPVADLILECIESGAIDRKGVRQIIVGLSANAQSISIWQHEEWDDYNEYRDDQAVAELSNSEWLDMVDTIGFSDKKLPSDDIEPSEYLPNFGVRFINSEFQTRYRKLLTYRILEIKEALEQIATGQMLGEFNKLVGLMGIRISSSGYADLAAIYHPEGAAVLPASERRLPGYSSIYGWMALTDEGLIHFYTEGEDEDDLFDDEEDEDSENVSVSSPLYNHYKFEDMELWYFNDDEIVFQLKSSGQQIEFDHGHTYDEWGGLSQEEINRKLIDHFEKNAEHLFFKTSEIPSPDDKAAWKRWLDLYEKSVDRKPYWVIEHAVKEQDIGRAEAFITSQKLTEKEKSEYRGRCLEVYINQKEYSKAVEHFSGLDKPAIRNDAWKNYYRALAMTGDYEKILSTAADEMKSEKDDSYKFTTHTAHYVIAGIRLKKDIDFKKTLAKAEKSKDSAMSCIASALTEKAGSPLFRRFVIQALGSREYRKDFLEEDFSKYPESLAEALKLNESREKKIPLEEKISAAIKKSKDRTEPEEFNPLESFLDKWPKGSGLKRCRIKRKTEEESPVKKEFFRDKNGIWVETDDGFGCLDLSSDKINLSNQYKSEDRVYALTGNGGYIYAVTYHYLKIFSISGDKGIEPVSERYLFTGRSPEDISCSEGLAVVSTGKMLEVYDVSDPASPELTSVISLTENMDGYCSAECILLKNRTLYVPFDGKGCLVLDLSDLSEPIIRSYLHSPESATGIAEKNGIVSLYSKDGLTFIDYSNPEKPQVLKSLKNVNNGECLFDLSGEEGFEFFGTDNHCCCYSIRFSAAGKSPEIDSWPVFAADEENTESVYYVKTAVRSGNGYLVIDDDGRTEICFEDMVPFKSYSTDLLEKGKEKLEKWLIKQAEDFSRECPDDQAGHFHLEMCHDICTFYIDGQKSLPGINIGPIAAWDPEFFEFVQCDGKWSEIGDLWFDEKEDDDSDEYNIVRGWQAARSMEVLKELYFEVIQKICAGGPFKKAAPGKIYLTYQIENVFTFAVHDNGGKWEPWRKAIQGKAELQLSKILEDYSRWETYARKCDDDEDLKKELYELALTGDSGALQVVRRRFNQDEDDSVKVLLDVIVNREDYFWFKFIDDFSGRSDVQEACKKVYDKLLPKLKAEEEEPRRWAGALVDAAVMLGYQDREELDTLPELMLFKNRPDYDSYDTITAFFRATKDIGRFADVIKKAVDEMDDNDNRLCKLSEQLFRAGIYEIPEGVLIQSGREKRGEQYDDVKIGIKSLDRNRDQYDQCRIERLFTGRMILENFRACHKKDDRTKALWPKELEPEPYPSSWRYLVSSVLKQMDIDSELDDFINVLSYRLKNDEKYKQDRLIFQALFHLMIESLEYERISRMGEMIGSVKELEEFKKLDELRRSTEINIAWKANADDDLETAKKYTYKLLDEGVENAYIYFLDARLKWKESNDPARAVETAQKYLPGMHGGSGKARVLNLVGCAYDELKKYPEALRCFTEASENDPNTTFYFDNIAEIYDKMKEDKKAYEWAKEAVRRGSKADIVKEIIKKNAEK